MTPQLLAEQYARSRGLDVEDIRKAGHRIRIRRPRVWRRSASGTLNRSSIDCQIRGVNVEARTIQAVVATEQVAMDQAILLLAGLDTAEYNRVLLWGHNVRTENPEMVIGRCLSLQVTRRGLEATFELATHPLAQRVLELMAGGFLRAFSISFRILEHVMAHSPAALRNALPAFARQALESGAAERVVTRSKLVEISVVPVGADTQALLIQSGNRQALPGRAHEPQAVDMPCLPAELVHAVNCMRQGADCLEACDWENMTRAKRRETLTKVNECCDEARLMLAMTLMAEDPKTEPSDEARFAREFEQACAAAFGTPGRRR